MKRLFMLTVFIGAAITTALAQGKVEPANPKSPTVNPGQSGQMGNPPQSQPAAPTPPPQMSQGGKAMPQAKSQEEYKAYQDAIAATGPAAGEAAAEAFAAKYPDSELRALIYRKAMYDYQNANNGDKTVEMAKK